MIFKKFILNNNIWDNLNNAFIKNKIPNAYIFYGSEGIGKEAHAIEFAAKLNCKRQVENSFPCGDCRSCIKIKKMQHEEIHFIHPSPASNKKSQEFDPKVIDELKKQYKNKSNNPYYKIELSKSNTIPISSIRNLKKKIFFSKSDENWTVVIITNAEKLCIPKPESANALLKILEEPPDKTLFILTTSAPNFLMSTIQSRCQQIFFPNLTNNQIEKYVMDNNIEADLSCIELANGSMTNILFNINQQTVTTFKDLLNTFFSTDLSSINEFQESISEIKSKNELCKFLEFICVSIKDLYYLSLNTNGGSIDYKFLQKEYQHLIESYPHCNWNIISDILNISIKNIKNNVNKNLEIYNLLINVRYCLEGKNVNTLKSELIK